MKAIRFSLEKLGTASRVTQQTGLNVCTDPQVSVQTSLSADQQVCAPATKKCRGFAAD